MKSVITLLNSLVDLHPDEAARAFEELDAEEAAELLHSLPSDVISTLLERISPHSIGPLFAELSPEKVRDLLSRISLRWAAVVLKQLPEEQREEVLSGMPKEKAKPLADLAKYPAESAGGIMEPRVASLSLDQTTEQAIASIRKTPRDVLHYLYVTDRKGRLVGVLSMRDLLLSNPHDPIRNIVHREVFSVTDTMAREDIVNLMTERRFVALPVVDYEDRLVGVIKHDQMIQAGQFEAFEDLQTVTGAGAIERALSPVSVVVKSRIPWLMVNLLTAFMAAAVVGLFEGVIARVAALAVLLPVVAGQGGNTGAQSLAVVLRGLALREIIAGSEKRVILKEFLAGLTNGFLIAIVTSVAVFFWQYVWSQAGMTKASGLSAVIFLSMIISMSLAALTGSLIPIIFKAIGRDPAQSSAIFLTTVTDIVGLGSFLGFATIFLPMIE
ncbi:magnesium transporter [Calycomorphotria hydatis]|uniref:Magnesium transporter MgtE n=1 Tax=Calycomorphotria hydatis TaxID=2528027 RepID=A0A517TAT5_9PLAN|nr:magnesium transporter [Calycomorphotria hydatis]QDT65488.1 Magnesium transporter MgtE [Calycomorphotria hydatis]